MIKCNSCSTSMILDRSEAGPSSSSAWYECPLCGKVRLTCSKTSATATLKEVQVRANIDSAADFLSIGDEVMHDDIAEYHPVW